MRLDHPLTQGPLTLERFAVADHLLVSSMSCETTDIVDQALTQHGLSRHIAMTVHHVGLVSQIIRNSKLIAVVPSTMIEHAIFAGEVAVSDPPVMFSPTPVVSLWHKRQDLDPGLTWLRGYVNRLITEHAREHYAEFERRYCLAHKRELSSLRRG
jgi:DNA-binding transcriptional LysR family regulator